MKRILMNKFVIGLFAALLALPAMAQEDELKDLCGQCIRDKEGAVTEEDCMYNCPWTDSGMLEVLDHYHINLKDLIESQGF